MLWTDVSNVEGSNEYSRDRVHNLQEMDHFVAGLIKKHNSKISSHFPKFTEHL